MPFIAFWSSLNPKNLLRTYALLLVAAASADCASSGTTLVLGHEYEVRASSALVQNKLRYGPENVIPPSLSRAWCEGAPENGIGEWIELTPVNSVFEKLELAIVPGYARNDRLFRSNGRPRKMSVTINGAFNREIEIKDLPEEQTFSLELPKNTKLESVRLGILEVHSGSEHQDTCITEVLLLPVRKPFIHDDLVEADNEAAKIPGLEKRARAGDLDAIEELIRMSRGSYVKTAEGGEYLHEIYLDLFAMDSSKLLLVASRLTNEVRSRLQEALLNPVNDKYTFDQLLQFLAKSEKSEPRSAMANALRSGFISNRNAIRQLGVPE